MDNVSIFATAVKVKTNRDVDTREILTVESVGEVSREVMTMDMNRSFVRYSFDEITHQYMDI